MRVTATDLYYLIRYVEPQIEDLVNAEAQNRGLDAQYVRGSATVETFNLMNRRHNYPCPQDGDLWHKSDKCLCYPNWWERLKTKLRKHEWWFVLPVGFRCVRCDERHCIPTPVPQRGCPGRSKQ